MAITSEFYFPSSDGKTLIHVNQWTPTEHKIVGVVQIAHGVAEYGDMNWVVEQYNAAEPRPLPPAAADRAWITP